jgi:tetratricopeptide (TPR) repeat protein
MAAIKAGQFEQALTSAEAELDKSPAERAPLLALAGLAAQRLGAPHRAIPHLRELFELNPGDQATRANLVKALFELGALEEALPIAAGGQTPTLHRLEGSLHQQLGDLPAAADAYRRVLLKVPDEVSTLNNLGNVLAELGEVDEAISCFEMAITYAPAEVAIYMNLANVLRESDRGEARLKVMRDAAALAPEDRAVQTELALALAHADQFDEALRLLETTCRRFPEFGESQLELGRMYESFNRIEDLSNLIEMVDQQTNPPEAAFLRAWLALREGRFDDAAHWVSTIPETIDPMRRAHLLGSIEERRGNADVAFAAFKAMNEATIVASRSSGPNYRESVEQRSAAWTDDWVRDWRTADTGEDGMRDPIFLVGFPRSGTTLLDTMLMGNDRLQVLEERPMIARLARGVDQLSLPGMSDDGILRLRAKYADIARQFGWNGTSWLVDKQPLNMVHAPLMHRMFPNAKFILAERHPYDVVLSCFMANFQPNFAMRSFTDLVEAARAYDAVFTAWEKATRLLQVDYRTVRYERLVLDPAAELRPLVAWIGLEWSDRFVDHTGTAKSRGRVRTASYAQIGEPLYTRARHRWRRYVSELAPVIPILKPWAERLGYEVD